MVMHDICNKTEGRSDKENKEKHLKSGEKNLKTKYNNAYI